MKRERDARGKNYFLGWTVIPVFGFLTTIFLAPFFYMLWLSFTNLSFAGASEGGEWIAFANYTRAILHDGLFLRSLTRSLLFAILCLAPEMLLAVGITEILQGRLLAQRVLTPLFALPVLLPSVIVGLYWRILLQGEFGLLSYYLSVAGVPGAKGMLSNPNLILFVVAAIDVWQWCPFVTLVLLAARSSLPNAPLHAAWLDGASKSRAFLDVTLPALRPTIFTVCLIRAIDSFKEFDKVFILTGGGPGTASELASIYTWRVAFKQFDFGYAAALCILIYGIIYFSTQLTLRSALRSGAK